MPAVYQGVGGRHANYPRTIMMTSPQGVRERLEHDLARLQDFDFRLAVIFAGHCADEQLAMIDDVAAAWRAKDHALQVVATGVNRCASAPLSPILPVFSRRPCCTLCTRSWSVLTGSPRRPSIPPSTRMTTRWAITGTAAAQLPAAAG